MCCEGTICSKQHERIKNRGTWYSEKEVIKGKIKIIIIMVLSKF